MTQLVIRLLGSFQASLDGELIDGFHSDKVRALLTYLCVEGERPHRRERLAGLLWPDLPERSARTNLRHALANLRQVIGDRTSSGDRRATPAFLLITRQTIQFNGESDAWVDARALASVLQATQRPISQLEDAVDWYRGEFLEGFSLPDSSIFEEWLLLQRERFQRLALDALRRLAESYTTRGEYERALAYAWRQVDLDPLREKAQRQLMRLLSYSDRAGEALAQYETCRRILGEELGAEPSTETTDLCEQIRDGMLQAPPPSLPPGPTHNLPAALTPLVGRETEVRETQDLLRDPACRLLTLVGPGGIGKTHLALEVGRRLVENHSHRVFLVRLVGLQSADAIVPAIAAALGFRLYGQAEPKQQLLDYLQGKTMLLILDNFEHLLSPSIPDEGEGDRGGVELVLDVLRAASGVTLLITSRTRLNLRGEQLYLLGGLGFPESDALKEIAVAQYGAVQLFTSGARRVCPDFQLAGQELHVTRICQLVQGLPLGILLAAAWMDVLSPAEIAAEIDKGLDFLVADWADTPERQRSLRGVLDRSWALLTEREKEVFQALSVFSGGFSRTAAQYVSEGTLRELRALVDKSLLQHTPSGWYEVHELLRQYGAEKLCSLPDAATEVSDRHCAYYVAALQRWATDLTGVRQLAALVEMEAENGNISAAWTWAVGRGQIERLDIAMEGLEHYYWQIGRYREGEAALRAAGAAAAAVVESAADRAACLRVWVRALAWQSNFQRAMGQRDAAQQLQQQCLVILQDPSLAGTDTRLERGVLSWSMGATVCMEDYARGRQRFEESYFLFRELDHRWGMAWALNAWGVMSMFLGAYGDAKLRLDEGLAINQALGNRFGVAYSVANLAEIACVEGRFDEAELLAREGVDILLEAGGRTEWALALLNLGEVLEYVAKFSEARSVLQQSLELYTDLGHRHYVIQTQSFLGSIEMHSGCYRAARERAQTGLALAREHGPQFCVALSLLLQGCLELVQGAYATAYQLLEECAAIYREVGPRPDHSLAMACLAIAAYMLQDTRCAREHLGLALEIVQESGAVRPLLWVLPAASLLLSGAGETQRAVELYALASRYPFVANSRWFEDVAGKEIAAVAESLPPEVAAAAQERGRARDLWATAEELLDELGGSQSG